MHCLNWLNLIIRRLVTRLYPRLARDSRIQCSDLFCSVYCFNRDDCVIAMIPPKARAGNAGRPTLSESIRFVSDRPVGSNKAVTQIARNAKSTPFVTGRRVTADETGKKNGGCPWAAWPCGRRETNRSVDRLNRLNAGSLDRNTVGDPSAGYSPPPSPYLPTEGCDQTEINSTSR